VTDVRHNGGGFMDVDGAPEGTEVIALFRKERGKTNTKVSFYGQPGIWAYKASDESGRLVVTGSHPEDAASGDILNLTSSMFKYAWDGSGIATVKAVLSNGDMIPMTKGTQDNMPQYTAIGDRQCHHFVFWLPKDANSVSLDIQAADEYDMELYLKKDDFAFPDNTPDYSSAVGGGLQSIKAGPLEKGLWYVTVRCASTVTATEVITDKTNGLGRRFVYSGNTGVLNGVPYTISLNWK